MPNIYFKYAVCCKQQRLMKYIFEIENIFSFNIHIQNISEARKYISGQYSRGEMQRTA